MANQPKIFLSYTRRDSSGIEAADLVERELKEAGFDVWRDVGRLEAGDNWSSEIEQELEREVLLAVISPRYRDSEMCRAEHILALRLNHRVLPLLVNANVPMPLSLAPKQYLDLSRPETVHDLLQALRTLGSSAHNAELTTEYRPPRRSNVIRERRPEHFVPRSAEVNGQWSYQAARTPARLCEGTAGVRII